MNYQLVNDFISVSIKQKGAELASLKKSDSEFEYIWQAEPAVWARHAPILFPIVGKLRNNSYRYNDVEYYLPQHGFARDMDFTLVSSSETSLLLELTANEISKTNYPFDFVLRIGYQLDGPRLGITWEVINKGDNVMPFSIGGHPGFNLLPEETLNDYHLEFDKQERVPSYYLDGGLIAGVAERFKLNREQIFALDVNTFDNDAVVLPNLVSESVTLRNRKNNYQLTMGIAGFDYLGIWSKPGQPFICVEPWLGIADSTTGDADITKKMGIKLLPSHETFSKSYFIQVG